jgi:hypothetical protein
MDSFLQVPKLSSCYPNEFLPDFLTAAHLRFAATESLRFAAADSLRLPRFGFNFPKGNAVAGTLFALVFVPRGRPRRPFPTTCPSRAAIAPDNRSRSCFNTPTISVMVIAGL